MMVFVLLSVLVLALGKKVKSNQSEKTELSRNAFGNKWLGAILVLVFGSGIINYQYSNKIWQGSPFGTKGFTLSSNFENVYEPLPTSFVNENLFKEKRDVNLVNDQAMISIYENVPTCSSKRRIDLVQRDITRMQVPLRRLTYLNSVDLFDTVCTVINDKFGKQYSVLRSGLDVIPSSRTIVDYNFLRTEFELSSGNKENKFVWSSPLPYDKYWKLYVNGVAVELKSDDAGFLTSKFPNRDSKILIELKRDPSVVYLYSILYLGHLLTLFFFSFLLIKRFRGTRNVET